MKFICINRCFYLNQLWDIGQIIKSDDDLSNPSKKTEVSNWKRIDKSVKAAMTAEKKTGQEIIKMTAPELILYAHTRFKADLSGKRPSLLSEISSLEKARKHKPGYES